MTAKVHRNAVLVAVIVVGLAGLWPRSGAGIDTVAWLAWIAVWCFPAGWLVGAARIAKPVAILAPSAVWFACAWMLRADPRTAPGLHWAALASCGMSAAGVAAGARSPGWGMRGAGLSFALLAALCWLPGAGGLMQSEPWSPAVAARLLDLSPATLLIECAGIDWMRHPAVYEPVGADAIGPDSRLPWRGGLAGTVVLLVGCALALATHRADRKAKCPPASSSAPFPRT